MHQDRYMKLQRFSAWCGFILLVGFMAAYTTGGLITPMDPTLSSDEVVEWLKDNQTGILACVAIMVLTVPFEYPFVVVTSLQLKRIEGGWGLLSMTQVLTGVVAPIGFFFPLAILSAAAYRPERHSADVLSAMVDIYWLMLVGNACIFVLQVWCIGYGALIDRRAKPIFPRWFGWLNIVLGVALIPGAFVYLNKTGPFAWNGLLAYLIPTIVYTIWKIATPAMLLRAIKHEEAELAEAKEKPEATAQLAAS
ncbi:hypothetical protein OG252_08105 [Streptomyces sp. NBC_01352]|uniref:DUF4386 domain-containing protein n=1 Tax=Streptomyces plumbiresistens TaxID=511811 RepID=A0ABP7SAD7_9ACTN|nr:hypothetical protein [Streptomyces sp. NBC_01352]